jgi:hypothetical protein
MKWCKIFSHIAGNIIGFMNDKRGAPDILSKMLGKCTGSTCRLNSST